MKKKTTKQPYRKILAIVAFVCLGIAAVSGSSAFFFSRKAASQEKKAQEAVYEASGDVERILKAQAPWYPEKPTNAQRHAHFALLGIFDPYADEKNEFALAEGSRAVSLIQNVAHGFFTAKAGLPEKTATDEINRVIEGGMNFDVKRYFQDMQGKLDQLQQSVEANSSLSIIASWSPGFGRTNNVFTAEGQQFMFPDTQGMFIDFSHRVSSDTEEGNRLINAELAQIFPSQSLRSNLTQSLDLMHEVGVEIVYKCEGKTIFILTSVTNNGLGFVHNGTSGKDASCGLLRGRFEFLRDEKVADGWYYFTVR